MALESLLLLSLAALRMWLAPAYFSFGGARISRVRHAPMPPRQPPVVGLALRGIANTLRARWSAPHRRDGGEDVDAAIMWGAGKTPRIWWIALEGGSLGSFLVGFSGDLLRLNNYAEHIA